MYYSVRLCPFICISAGGSYEFICDNGQCVPSDFYCDGEDDCDDDSDEQGCCM